MKEYKIAYVARHLGKYILAVKENESADAKWLQGTEYNTKKAALSRFKAMYAPLGTKEIVKVQTFDFYEVYEAR